MFSFSPLWARTILPVASSASASWCLARATIVMRAVPTVATWLIIVSAGRLPLVGHETEWQERQRIWQSVLFYNYLQVAMGGPRKAGSDAEYRQAEEAFFSVLDQYRPQYIIAWGNRLWGEMPGGERWQDGDDITIDGYTVNTGSYALSGGRRVKVMAVNHPSVGYSWDWWHKVIETFLKR